MLRVKLLEQLVINGVTYPIDSIIVMEDENAYALMEENKVTDILGLQVTTAGTGITPETQAALDKKQTVFTGICQEQYLTENDIVIDCVSATPKLTIATVKNGTTISALNPICFYTDGNGMATKHTKSAPVSVNFTYTLGVWYFYFDSNGDLQASQTTWTDFSTIAPVYRIYLNNTLSGQARCVVESIEFHKNDVSWTEHQHMHSGGTIHVNGGDVVSNLPALSGTGVPTTPPNADGRNTVISLTTIKNQDDNMPYTVTNSTDAVTKFNQNLGHLTAGTLTSLNSALFKVRTNDANGRLFFLPATRFPFPWDTTTNRPEYITASGVRTLVTDNRWFVTYVYALQDPRNGEAIKIVPEITDFTSYVNAQASTWDNLKAVYPTIRDNEIRPLYKLTFYNDNSGGGAYNVACKFSSLVRIDDLRKDKVGGVSNVSGTVLASSVQVTPTGSITETNVQAVLDTLGSQNNITTGTEYDTGERIDGAIVYGKIINFGTLPNATTKNVPHGISSLDMTKIIEHYGTIYNATLNIQLPLLSIGSIITQAYAQIDSTNITITTGSDRSSFTCSRYFIKYLK